MALFGLSVSKIPASAVAQADQNAARLGAFPDTASHRIEPEFYGMPPRIVPDDVMQGPSIRSQRVGTLAVFVVGALSLGLSRVGWVERISYYILPLKYLGWFGIGALALGVIGFAIQKIFGLHERLVRDGTPIVVRILESGIFSYKFQHSEMYVAYAIADYRHPETGAIERVQFKKELGNAVWDKDWGVTLKPGDLATAVYRGKNPSKAVLYGFTRLNASVNFIVKNGKPWDSSLNATQVVVSIVLIFGVFGLMAFGGDGLGAWPIDAPPWKAMVGSAVGCCAAGIFLFALLQMKYKKKGLWAVGAIFGLLGGIFAPPTLNSALDKSEPTYRDAQIVNYWQQTNHGIIRNYQIEYRELPAGRNRKYHMRREEMGRFTDTNAAVLEVKKGYFGWPWISAIDPVEIIAEKADRIHSGFSRITKADDGTSVRMYLGLAVHLNNGKTIDPSPALAKIALETVSQEIGGRTKDQEE